MDPNITSAFKTLYIPAVTFDKGLTWEYLVPCVELHEAKRRLRSRLPSAYTMKSKGKPINIKCGLLIVKPQTIVGHEVFIELVAEDLQNDANLPG